MTKQQAMELAQRTANRDNAPVTLLKLNPFSPLYVVREWDDPLQGSRDLVARLDPQ